MHAEMKCKKYMVYAYTNFTYLNICEQISYAMQLQMPNIFQKNCSWSIKMANNRFQDD